MNKISIVSVVDSNKINQNALLIMLKSIYLYSPDLISLVAILFPKNTLPYSYINTIDQFGIKMFPYYLNKTDDPYKAKFLLAHFILNEGKDSDYIFYMDPDHLVFRNFITSVNVNEFLISSELSEIHTNKTLIIDDKINHQINYTHYNTSIIFAHNKTWKTNLRKWFHRYRQFSNLLPHRYREEIAFSTAAVNNNIIMKTADVLLQSNFMFYNMDCALFHYGGETKESKQLKNNLENIDLIYGRLLSQLNKSRNLIETWLIMKFLDIVKR